MSFKCPNCSNDGDVYTIRIRVNAYLHAVPCMAPEMNGEQAWITDTVVDEWEPNSPCICDKCGHEGTYSDFATEEG